MARSGGIEWHRVAAGEMAAAAKYHVAAWRLMAYQHRHHNRRQCGENNGGGGERRNGGMAKAYGGGKRQSAPSKAAAAAKSQRKIGAMASAAASQRQRHRSMATASSGSKQRRMPRPRHRVAAMKIVGGSVAKRISNINRHGENRAWHQRSSGGGSNALVDAAALKIMARAVAAARVNGFAIAWPSTAKAYGACILRLAYDDQRQPQALPNAR